MWLADLKVDVGFHVILYEACRVLKLPPGKSGNWL